MAACRQAATRRVCRPNTSHVQRLEQFAGRRKLGRETRTDAEVRTRERVVQTVLKTVVKVEEISGRGRGDDECVLDRVVLKLFRQHERMHKSAFPADELADFGPGRIEYGEHVHGRLAELLEDVDVRRFLLPDV